MNIPRVIRAEVVPMRELKRTNFKGKEKFRGWFEVGSPDVSSRLGNAIDRNARKSS
jgi:hypothetical protein